MTIKLTIHIKKYKSFYETGASLQEIRPINVIIGKNNIGKSSFLDIFDALTSSSKNHEVLKGTQLSAPISEKLLKHAFPSTHSGGDLPGNHWNSHGIKLINSSITWTGESSDRKLIDIHPEGDVGVHPGARRRIEGIISAIETGVQNKKFIRLNAERDITPEDDSGELNLSPTGTGATKIIHRFLHHSNYERELINNIFVSALNTIFEPDIHFNEVTTRFHSDSNRWEIFLAEDSGELFALSKSGSGIKTIILILLNLLIRPIIENSKPENYIYAFEEPENNLHPSLQRNLFLYLERFSKEKKCHIFITTHSNIAIDAYSNSDDAQILHIKRVNGESTGEIYQSTTHGYSILEDLGVRASDILQANGLIWVEGPSDRVFLNTFIRLWGNGELREGAHYQFAFYGGSVLANLNTDIPEDKFQDALSVFRINRNFIFSCDSDRRAARGPLKQRVKDLITSLDSYGGLHWVSKCKEIENYIPKEAFEAVHKSKDLPQITEYEYIQDYLKNNSLSAASEYRDKHQKAALYSEHFTKDNLAFRPELDEIMQKICRKIRDWNHL